MIKQLAGSIIGACIGGTAGIFIGVYVEFGYGPVETVARLIQ